MSLTNWLKPTDHGHWEMNTETGIARRTHPSLPRSRLAGEGRVGVSKELETCAACHSRRRVIAKNPTPGAPLLDSYLPALLEAGLYHDDGQIDGEVYEYGSFLQSRMSHAGVTCSDCHDPHSTRLRAEGNALCAQCHMPAKFDAAEHHHHQPGSTGAQCVNCHMPSRAGIGRNRPAGADAGAADRLRQSRRRTRCRGDGRRRAAGGASQSRPLRHAAAKPDRGGNDSPPMPNPQFPRYRQRADPLRVGTGCAAADRPDGRYFVIFCPVTHGGASPCRSKSSAASVRPERLRARNRTDRRRPDRTGPRRRGADLHARSRLRQGRTLRRAPASSRAALAAAAAGRGERRRRGSFRADILGGGA